MNFDLSNRTHLVMFLTTLFFLFLGIYAFLIPYPVYAALTGFLLRVIESLFSGIFLTVSVGSKPTATPTSTDVIPETMLEPAITEGAVK